MLGAHALAEAGEGPGALHGRGGPPLHTAAALHLLQVPPDCPGLPETSVTGLATPTFPHRHPEASSFKESSSFWPRHHPFLSRVGTR